MAKNWVIVDRVFARKHCVGDVDAAAVGEMLDVEREEGRDMPLAVVDEAVEDES